jgi:integrase/recombinase XerD
MNKTVSILKRVQIGEGLRYCPTVETSNGKIRADVVMVAGKEERHPEGSFYISWYEGKKQIRVAVGKEVSGALVARNRKQAELEAKNNGVEIVEKRGNGGASLAYAVEQFLEDVKGTKKPKTLAAYTTALNYFTESCHKVNIADIERRDLLRFVSYLRDEKDQSPRSVFNKFETVMSFLKTNGVRGIVGKNDWPKYTEETPEIYEDEELTKLFAACDAEERLWYQFFLTTGMREQEVMYAYWRDISFAHSEIRITHKPDHGWTPKAYKEREIPLPMSLLNTLKARKEKIDGKCPLIFPTAGCKPKFDFLDCLKAIAKRAGMNPEHFWLHKFRSTYATKSLCGGTDVRTVQSYLGHSDLESTLRYLKPSRSKTTRDKVNDIFGEVIA